MLSHSRLVASLPLWRAALAAHATSTIALYDATLTALTSLPRKARREPILAYEYEAPISALAYDTPPYEYAL
ncbi:hypothetical protein [uncultured Prevotella sp.]|uniref:hypothetical protein n=1 Tax=uncultured Prevotella sp. TaxID=159272 RepID=UPI002596AB7C|nr:hypothetical protein [uncultured Prevotella sp.]